jgi:hypothetical protein
MPILFQGFTAAAAVTGAIIAILGYRKWKPESIGKRKIELAEQMLADFHQARDVIDYARTPTGWAIESDQRKPAKGETSGERRRKDAYFRTFQRLKAYEELFVRLQTRKYQAVAHFGGDARKPIEALGEVHAKVLAASGNLSRYYKSDGELPESWDEWETSIGWLQEDGDGKAAHDEIALQLQKIVDEADRFYGQWLMRR